jgi:hypothetical protein
MDHYWHFYTGDQIESEMRGDRVLVLGFSESEAGNSLVEMHSRELAVWRGRGLHNDASSAERITEQHGIVFGGVSLKGLGRIVVAKHEMVQELIGPGVDLSKVTDADRKATAAAYNKFLISYAKTVFLAKDELPPGPDLAMLCLTSGALHLLPHVKAANKKFESLWGQRSVEEQVLISGSADDLHDMDDILGEILRNSGFRNATVIRDPRDVLVRMQDTESPISVLLLTSMVSGASAVILNALAKWQGPKICVVMLSGKHDSPSMRRFFLSCQGNALAVDYLEKPLFEFERLGLSLKLALAWGSANALAH